MSIHWRDSMHATVYTKEQLEQYIIHCEQRIKESASPWMKAEIRRGIELAKQELEKIQVSKS